MINSHTNKMYYKVYGLNISSDIYFEELEINNDNFREFDIEIIRDSMPLYIKEEIQRNVHSYYSKEDTWFNVIGVGIYRVLKGKQIIFEPYEQSNIDEVKIYILCSCLGFVMIQREMLAIHGGALLINGSGVIITGNRGAGKSTLTTALRLKGYDFIADDVASTFIESGKTFIHPGFPYQKLCEDVLEKFDYKKDDYISSENDKNIKYLIPVNKEFVNHSVPLSTIIEIKVEDVQKVTMKEIKGAKKISRLINNIYRTEFIGLMGGMSPKYFKECLNITNYVKFYEIVRPKEGFTVSEQIRSVEEILFVLNSESVG